MTIAFIAMVEEASELLKLFEGLNSRWQTTIGFFVLALVVIPYLFRLWDTWIDTRSGKRLVAHERARLEVLKLRYEIEAIRKHHDLPELEPMPVLHPTVQHHDEPARTVIATTAASLRPVALWRWLGWLAARQSSLAKGVVWLLLILIGVYFFFFIVCAAATPVLLSNGQISSWGIGLVVIVFYGACAFGMFRLMRVWYRQLRLLREPPPLPAVGVGG